MKKHTKIAIFAALTIIANILTAPTTSEASTLPKQNKPRYTKDTRIRVNRHYSPSLESIAWRIIREQERMERETGKDYRKP